MTAVYVFLAVGVEIFRVLDLLVFLSVGLFVRLCLVVTAILTVAWSWCKVSCVRVLILCANITSLIHKKGLV